MRKLWVILLFLAFILIYYPALFNFFTQDDFSLLLNSQAKNLKEFFSLFKPLEKTIYYRPLSMQLYFFLIPTLFGLRPLAFHLIAFLFHLLNGFLVYRLIKILTKKVTTAFFVSCCFLISTAHFMSLFWICEFSLILSSFFSFLAFIKYLEKKTRLFLFFFLLALLSNEFSATLPLIILAYELIFKKRFALKKLLIPIVLVLIFILIRFFLFPTHLGEFYKLSFTPKQFLSNLRWYLFRSLSLPELIKDFLKQEIILQINLVSSLIFLSSSFLIPNVFLFKKKKVNYRILPRTNTVVRGLLFAFFWFVLALLPVLFMPKHLLSSYLTLGLPGILLFWLNSLASLPKKFKKTLIAISLVSFFIASLISVRFLEKHHWIVYRAAMAQKNLENLRQKYPKLENKSLIFFKNNRPGDSKELYFAFSGESAVRVFYRNLEVEVLFEDFQQLPAKDNRKVYLIPVKTSW